MKTFRILSLILLLPLAALAQNEKKQFIRKGILSTYLTLTPARMTGLHVNSVYLHGNAEYYFDNKTSVRGDGFYYINGLTKFSPLEFNHNLFFGPSWHFKTSNAIDPYFSLQPGVSYTKDNLFFGPVVYSTYPAGYTRPASFNPLVSGTVGFNYFATRFFHLFAETRYVHGTYRASNVPFSLGEIRISFGLAFNLGLVKAAE